MLVREWKGKLERVTILEKGFAWNGKSYDSLSQIAKAMTGTSWNGPTNGERFKYRDAGAGVMNAPPLLGGFRSSGQMVPPPPSSFLSMLSIGQQGSGSKPSTGPSRRRLLASTARWRARRGRIVACVGLPFD